MKDLLLIAVPKSGGHALAQALDCTPYSPFIPSIDQDLRDEDEVIKRLENAPNRMWGHVPFSEKIEFEVMQSFRAVVFLYRDPADICVSMAHYIDKAPASWFNQCVSADLHVQDISLEERILFYVDNYGRLFGWFTGWEDALVLRVRYEDLMLDMEQEMSYVRGHLLLGRVDVDSLSNMLMSGTRKESTAWRSGAIGEHKGWFDPEDQKHLLSGFTYAREKLGYA